MQELIEKDRITAVLNLYAQACDRRDWALFRTLFMPDIHADYGGFQFTGCEEVIAIIRNNLGGCGPTQHILCNYQINVDGDKATAVTQLRASHAGGQGKEGLFFEVWGEYRDQLCVLDGQWRIAKRQMVIFHEIGTRDVLAPEAESEQTSIDASVTQGQTEKV